VAFTLSRIDRINRTYDVTVTLANGTAQAPATAAFALLSRRANPTATTVWTSVAVVNGAATVLLAGPDANPTGALVVPGDADLWLRSTDAPEVDAEFVERIAVLGGGPPLTPPPVTSDALIAALLNDPTSATYAKVVALITARTGFGRGA
jgi:hypothetical protein